MARDPQHRGLVYGLSGVAAVAAAVFLLVVPEWDAPPIVSVEHGPDALAMNTFLTPGRGVDPLNVLEFPVPDPVADRGVTAGEAYGDVEVLADLDAAQFDRLMVAVTEWVAPNEGCTFCHAAGADGAPDYEAEPPYTFAVAREMLTMVREMNADPRPHVQPQGVTCFSCHRGQNVPVYTWNRAGEWAPASERWYGKPPEWIRTARTIRDFMPREAFSDFILHDRSAMVQAQHIYPEQQSARRFPEGTPAFERAEHVYLFMMQMSDGLGVNCTACHNSRAFYDWGQSTPLRVPAWYAIDQTRRANLAHISPLAAVLPAERLGPAGDAMKANCMTCHVGQLRPLNGTEMISHFPGLVAPSPSPPLTDEESDELWEFIHAAERERAAPGVRVPD
ncbi:photosynthetic reaction center cytochrome c subunit [Hasllibacter halocynthiae]|uniref:Photosynthetic reaction center cytochrome c subunit n=1 Tax=Hasllibacter halocynthiae TaxID=595589 RepID=A0A2T0WZM5_9RHOB|nr:photosynthetic reaction center cytochrome PufC [Hasllibacter halocynthiae]PRY92044.1 photosynthetic reaction center cytochrome c subunit [Hasllibacter halocynthiae]